jgi:leucyl aminopeptidase (aminopeptidase T)
MNKELSKFGELRAGGGRPAEGGLGFDFEKLREAARIAIAVSLKVQTGEQVLIITNPRPDVSLIAEALYDASLDAGGKPVLVYQPVKAQIAFAEPAVLAAFNAKPQAVISLSDEKLGKDPTGIATPYEYNGVKYDHIFHLQQYGEKTCRAFWSPSTTIESFIRTVPIDYAQLQRRCAAIKVILDKAVEAHVSAPGGTDITIGLRGREAKSDDGNFSTPGSGGNLPAGETFISPENLSSKGRICYDGSISVNEGELIINTPIECIVEDGYVTKILGAGEAACLMNTIETAERNAFEFERNGKLPPSFGEIYARNARNIGELGIGLNPAARITGKMLEDEKAFHTCHFAIGSNYDDDAPSLIHLDGLVKNPTITAIFEDGSKQIIEKDGELDSSILS